MSTRNINLKTAAQESSRKLGETLRHTRSSLPRGKKFRGRVGCPGIQQPDGAEKYRKNSPEKMRFNYSYALCQGMNKQFRYINVAEADHFKQFLRQIACSGVDIRDIY